MECGSPKVRYSFIFAARMTLPHFSFSAAMNVPNSTGEVAKAVSPQSAIVNKISGCDIDLEPCRLRSGRMPWAGLGRRKTDDGKNPNRLAADRADPWCGAVLMSPPRAATVSVVVSRCGLPCVLQGSAAHMADLAPLASPWCGAFSAIKQPTARLGVGVVGLLC